MIRTEERRRLAVFDTVLREIVWETEDTVTLLLDPIDHPRDYVAGQFVSIDPNQFRELKQLIAYFEKVKGRRETVRAYSMASIPSDPCIAITVKEEEYVEGSTEYPPLLSPFLVHGLEPGRKITVKGYSGYYHLPPDVEERTDHVLHLCSGSGIVPNYAMLRHSLEHHPRLRHTLVYSNKTWAEVIFAEQLRAMEERYRDRFQLVNCLTREPSIPANSVCARLGRISREVVEPVIGDPQRTLVYACGAAITRWDKQAARARGEEPKPRFLETVRAIVGELGVPRQNLHTEAY